jgi:hypothetical protein
MHKYVISLFAILVLGACGQSQWTRFGFTEQVSKPDRDSCLREAQELHVGTPVNAFGGPTENRYITNQKSYDACIAARGHSYRQLM